MMDKDKEYPYGDEMTSEMWINMVVEEITATTLLEIKEKLKSDLPNLDDAHIEVFAGHITMITALHNLLGEWNITIDVVREDAPNNRNAMEIKITLFNAD